MDWLNYHHLLYFWTVAREGTISAAGARLGLAQPTISSQLRVLERQLGQDLFVRQGRRLKLSEFGAVVYRYADEIFTLGEELQQAIRGHGPGRAHPLHVGVADVVPKLIVYHLLVPAFQLEDTVRLVCSEGKVADLLAELALHKLDVVIADTPSQADSSFRVYNHLLGESGVTVFAVPKLATRLRRNFPASLDGAPFLLPTRNTALRRDLQRWLDDHDLHPRTVAEFEDSALLKACGQAGLGAFAGPSAIADAITRQYNVRAVGELPGIGEQFYAISGERRLHNPAVVAITEAARKTLFG